MIQTVGDSEMSNEADIHFELYRHLQNAIDDDPETESIKFGDAAPEYNVDGGVADVVVFDQQGRAVLVIEAKRQAGRRYNRNIDPYSPVVIQQAFRYAGQLGAPYFATYNGEYLILFDTFESGVPLLSRKSRAYKVIEIEVFAEEILRELDGLRTERVNWDLRQDSFIHRLRVYHERLEGFFAGSLERQLESHEYRDRFSKWVAKQGWVRNYENDPDKVRHRFTSQASYLLMNRLVFFKLLDDSPVYEVPAFSLAQLSDPDTRLRAFARIVEELDFEAVYQQDEIFDSLPLSDQALTETQDFVDGLERFNLASLDFDVIGQVYQRIIPPDERHNLGQYYTPPEVVELIVSLSVIGGSDVVMDPGCGSGGFLVGAYKRLRELSQKSKPHQDTLNQIYGIDINRFPAHLSAINLALADLTSETRDAHILVQDFFHVSARQAQIEDTTVNIRGTAAGSWMPPEVDAVVGNPPYIRQEEIENKTLVRRHLGSLADAFSRRSDIYVYFITHATEFLRDGGRLGFITSARWLDVKYGEALQAFLANRYRIRAIVNFSRQQFELALISTCVMLLERCEDAEARDGNTVVFLQLGEPMTTNRIAQILESEVPEDDAMVEAPGYRIASRRQRSLVDETKWSRYLRAPALYWELMQSGRLTTLGELASVVYGIKTGANSFFYFRGRSEWVEAGIDRQFVTPLLKHVAETEAIVLIEEELEWWVLDIHPFVEELEAKLAREPSEEEVLDAIGNVCPGLRWYIDDGVAQGLPSRPSIEGRRYWFDLGELPRSPLMLSEVYWRESRTLLNTCEATLDKRLYGVDPPRGVDVELLAALLNSGLYTMMRELHGREEQGEGMNRNTLMVYEARELPIVDPRELESGPREAILQAFRALVSEEKRAKEERRAVLRAALDDSILRACGFEERADELGGAIEDLLSFRETGSGSNRGVLVDGAVRRTVELRGGERLGSIPVQGRLSL